MNKKNNKTTIKSQLAKANVWTTLLIERGGRMLWVIICLAFWGGCFLVSCDNDGVLVDKHDDYHYVTASWKYYGGDDDDIFSIKFLLEKDGIAIDSAVMSDTLTIEESISDSRVRFSESEGNTSTRLVMTNITDTLSMFTELDTIVDLRDNSSFVFLRMSADDDITLYSGSNIDEANPSETTSAKYQFYYNIDDLPDSVRMVFYRFHDAEKPYYIDSLSAPLDSIVIPNGEFSEYIELECYNINTSYAYFYKIKDTQTGDIIQDIKLLNPVLPLTTATGYSGAMTDNNSEEYFFENKGYTSYSEYKFMTILLYKSGSKYKTEQLFSTEWDDDEIVYVK